METGRATSNHSHLSPSAPLYPRSPGNLDKQEYKTGLARERHTQTVSPGDLVALPSRQEVLLPDHPATHGYGHLLNSLETPLWSLGLLSSSPLPVWWAGLCLFLLCLFAF